METKAQANNLRISPRKVRLVASVVRGMNALEAQKQLQFMNKKAAHPLFKLLNSALTNAEHNFKLKQDNLRISELKVNEGPTLKRSMPRAMGRASAINKRTSHVSITLSEIEPSQPEKNKKETVKPESKKKDKDVKVINSLDDVKSISKSEDLKDSLHEGSERKKQRLDTGKQKEKGGAVKKMFRRKSI